MSILWVCEAGGDQSHPKSPFISTVSCTWRISVSEAAAAALRTLLEGNEVFPSLLSVHRCHKRYPLSCLWFSYLTHHVHQCYLGQSFSHSFKLLESRSDIFLVFLFFFSGHVFRWHSVDFVLLLQNTVSHLQTFVNTKFSPPFSLQPI